MVPQAIK